MVFYVVLNKHKVMLPAVMACNEYLLNTLDILPLQREARLSQSEHEASVHINNDNDNDKHYAYCYFHRKVCIIMTKQQITVDTC